jgi:serine/threonine protein phosphatase PrpC
MSLMLRSVKVSDVGLVRTNNEDAAHAGRWLVALADGIGGMPSGELASSIVVHALADLDAELVGSGPTRVSMPVREALSALKETVEVANQQILEAGESDTSHDGMGTTVTALLLSGDEIALLNVGDSRCYLHRDGKLSQLTKDDTFVQTLVDQGVLTAEEARVHPRRSIVTQALQGLSYEATSAVHPVRPGDRFLLCSDGLSDMVVDTAIENTLNAYADLRECAEHLVKQALDAGALDNVTVVVAEVVAG